MKRTCGVLMHVSSLWGKYSIGSLGKEAFEWVDFLADAGFGIWQVLPFCLPDEFNSPYKSYSSFSTNPYFIDLDTLVEEGLLSRKEADSAIQAMPYSAEFERLSHERLPLLALAASRFDDYDSVDSFLEKYPYVREFCEFMARRRANSDTPWYEWECDDIDQDTLRTWKFTQFIFFRQWSRLKEYANKKGIKIIGDIPIYVSYDSADVWAHPEEFLLDKKKRPKRVAGVPPDYFCEEGQLWGNPLYNFTYMKTNGFKYWREKMRFMCDMFDGVRIDHFRAFESFYSVCADASDAKDGKWVKGPGMSLIRALREAAGDKILIAEDLGDITDAVRTLVNKSGFYGMRVLQFGFMGDENSLHLPHNYPKNCIAYTGTHDNNTLLGYVWELDGQTRKRLTDYCSYTSPDWNASYDAIITTLLRSSADAVVLPVQDLLLFGADTRLNVPGRALGNWGFRVTEEQIKGIDKKKFKYWNSLYARG